MPGSPLDPRAEGTNDLIRDGANLCASVEHVTSVLEPLIAAGPRESVMEESSSMPGSRNSGTSSTCPTSPAPRWLM